MTVPDGSTPARGPGEGAPAAGGRVLTIPESGLVVLVGVSGSGKSTFAARHFRPTQVVGSDFCRGLVSDDENDQSASADAFELLHHIVDTRLRRGLLTVVDATNVRQQTRAPLLRIAKRHDVLSTAVVLDVPERVARDRNRARSDRDFGDHVISRQRRDLRRGLGRLDKEGFRRVHVLRGPEEIDAVSVELEKAWNDRRHLTGPFDIVGDVHGCRAELEELLAGLGYLVDRDAHGRAVGARHPQGRTAVFVGDLVDRGPDTPGVLRLVMGMVAAGTALCVPGNHENKLVRALRGRKVTVAHGLAESLAQLDAEPEEFRAVVLEFCDGLVSHYVLDGGRLVVAHAGLKEEYHGRSSGRVRSFALYGETTGETDEYGLPVRHPWARDYRGAATVVYGHVPTPEPEWVNNTICIDTGCVFGGRLTALRYPERELAQVKAHRVWYRPARPFPSAAEAAPAAPPERDSGVLDVRDVLGEDPEQDVRVETAHGPVSVRAPNTLAALEVMSRFAVDPRWLLYLPPTMAPAPTSADPAVLERPAEAFAHYLGDGVERVICQEKHMGSRAVAVVCRDTAAAERRFVPGTLGTIHTRTGRPFFTDPVVESAVLAELRDGIEAAGLWTELDTDWIALDGELLPWSAKAAGLIREQYAAVGAAGRAALPAVAGVLDAVAARGLDVAELSGKVARRAAGIEAFSAVYRRYTWPVEGAAGLRYAPFAVLAGEGRSFADRDHLWHMGIAERLADHTPRVLTTRYLVVDVTDPAAVDAAGAWWRELVTGGGEGMVVKPLAGALARGRRGLAQPGLKVRGPEYLRIIYGPDYLEPDRIERLRDRSLGRKSGLALREHKLGLESLARHARGEPLWRVHQPVFGVLALESEPVDPRL
ncbi:polynucleotide kinase-phosphatase [Marinitenerispora sediminis]|uniref:Polynucleotide kinase-phosphatase n=1 Tax=Marinitenerispora sediminis TaxID=1931232 RepID=A0A368T820_9ACTN|nr:polynucleotide kinase-phosphatase [Marinitenerispora sediminis]RCV49900.1 polynucleotide kinase-phosphatase [Marinitenerispora sediminis]RCV54199.1 polynucleotide kinase-phosphatase [Marinitenerispora sediminis]RCV58355.1 polynucleotide kinase-phosphatase [Marinitenerispora sediminis]